jgi:hypothetical protein
MGTARANRWGRSPYADFTKTFTKGYSTLMVTYRHHAGGLAHAQTIIALGLTMPLSPTAKPAFAARSAIRR